MPRPNYLDAAGIVRENSGEGGRRGSLTPDGGREEVELMRRRVIAFPENSKALLRAGQP